MTLLLWLPALLLVFPLGGLVWIALGFVLHLADHLQRRSTDRPPLHEYARAFVFEYGWSLVVWCLYPWGLLRPRGVTWAPEGGPPVILVHGFMMNHASMLGVRRALERRGYRNVLSVNVRPLRAPLEAQAETLAARIRELSQACGGAPVIGIGHSQGGVLLRACAALSPAVPLAKIITIGSPHRGTRVAALAFAPNARQLRWGSPFLAGLGDTCRVELVSIYSDIDNIAFPASTSVLGRSVLLSGMGHHVLLFAERALDRIVDELPPLIATAGPSRRDPALAS